MASELFSKIFGLNSVTEACGSCNGIERFKANDSLNSLWQKIACGGALFTYKYLHWVSQYFQWTAICAVIQESKEVMYRAACSFFCTKYLRRLYKINE